MTVENKMIAVCGLICNGCDILEATNDKKIAHEIADWFKKEKHIEVKIEDIHCDGCKGDRKKHWSADCWILQCCVDKKGLDFCFQCEDFPCKKLENWSKESKEYKEALERLKEMEKN